VHIVHHVRLGLVVGFWVFSVQNIASTDAGGVGLGNGEGPSSAFGTFVDWNFKTLVSFMDNTVLEIVASFNI
jgi:hypothetical protein